jgi:hypothetical protein
MAVPVQFMEVAIESSAKARDAIHPAEHSLERLWRDSAGNASDPVQERVWFTSLLDE